MIHDFVRLMVALVWPLTILILVCWFRKGIKDLIKSVTEAKIGNSVFFKFWQAKTDVSAEALLPEPKDITAPSAAKWENTANLFWLGNDLEWTPQTALRGAPKERILHGLTKCNHHCSELGLASSEPGKQLSALKTQVESLPESALDRKWRNNFAEQMYSVVRGFDVLVKQHQPDFRPDP